MKTLWVIDKPNQVYKFSRLFSSSRLCDSRILDTGCKVHTRISTVFLVEFFCTHTVAGVGPTEEILILISIQQELHKGESEVHLLLAICANCCMVSFALIDALF